MKSTALRVRTCLVVLVLGTLAGTSYADNLDEFGFGPRASAMGGAMTGLASDWSAAYYNPAGLVNSKHVNASAGFSYAFYDLQFSSDRGGRQVDDRTNRIDPLSAFTLGVSSTIPIDCPDRLGVGIGLFIPTRHIANITANAPSSQPEWVLYGDHQDRIQVIPAIGVKIVDGLYVGGGASVFAVADGGTTADVGPPIQTQFNLELKPQAGGIFGVFFQPLDWLSFGLTYRTERSFKLRFNVVPSILNVSAPITIQSIDFFTPHQVSFGTAIDIGDSALLVLDVTYLNYSAFREPFLVTTSPSIPTPQRVHGDFQDTFIPRVGIELAATDWLFLRGGYFFRMSPVNPEPNQFYNLVDSDEHVFTIGVGFEYSRESPDATKPAADAEKKPAKKTDKSLIDRASFGADLFFQWHFIPGYSVRKTDPADPIGGYDAGGNIFNMGFAFTGRF